MLARSRSCWLVILPLLVSGSLAAHAVAYRLVGGSAADADELLAATGHGYLAELPIGTMIGLVTVAIGVVGLGVERRLGRANRAVPPSAYALLPLVGFAMQEHLERLCASGALSTHLLTSPIFLVGLALQLPFAAAAWLLVRLLSRVADVVAALLPAPTPPHAGVAPTRVVERVQHSRGATIARHLAPRGPPPLWAR